MSHLSTCDSLNMVFEHLNFFFNPKDSISGFIRLHQLSSHVTMGHIPQFVAYILGVARFLVLAKPSRNIYLIIVSEAFY